MKHAVKWDRKQAHNTLNLSVKGTTTFKWCMIYTCR